MGYSSSFDAGSIRKVLSEVADALTGVGVEDRRLLICVRELMDNAVFHSGDAEGWGSVEGSQGAVSVTIRDRGMGIHQSLTAVYPDISERVAVQVAFGTGRSGAFDDPNRGLGLGLVLDLTSSGAELLLESGGVAFVGSGGEGHTVSKSSQFVEGVVATLTVFP